MPKYPLNVNMILVKKTVLQLPKNTTKSTQTPLKTTIL